MYHAVGKRVKRVVARMIRVLLLLREWRKERKKNDRLCTMTLDSTQRTISRRRKERRRRRRRKKLPHLLK
jgi:hypothetical protein